MNEQLLALTASMPCKQIDINGRPYMQRYYAGETSDGHDLWIHRFLSCDGERHQHNHPFEAQSAVLDGGYVEEMPDDDYLRLPSPLCPPKDLVEAIYRGESWHSENYNARPISVFDWHRIASVEPETWTLFIVAPQRLPAWFFKNDAGELEMMKPSPRDWWKQYKTRAEQSEVVQ